MAHRVFGQPNRRAFVSMLQYLVDANDRNAATSQCSNVTTWQVSSYQCMLVLEMLSNRPIDRVVKLDPSLCLRRPANFAEKVSFNAFGPDLHPLTWIQFHFVRGHTAALSCQVRNDHVVYDTCRHTAARRKHHPLPL
jgi:hypothetical protein